MVKINNSFCQLSMEQIKSFELEYNISFPAKYKKFLLESNGGEPVPHVFFISNEQGESGVNVFFGIHNGEHDELGRNIELLDGRLPNGFIPIGDDPGGNLICLGTNETYYDKIYFWDHEEEHGDISNMYLLANDIYEFLKKLYDDETE